MGAALVPESVIATFPHSRRLRIHRLPPGENRLRTLLIWRKGLPSPNVEALADILGKKPMTARDRRTKRESEPNAA